MMVRVQMPLRGVTIRPVGPDYRWVGAMGRFFDHREFWMMRIPCPPPVYVSST